MTEKQLETIVVDEENLERVKGWCRAGDVVAVYENADLSDRNVGHTVFLRWNTVKDAPKLGSRLPDNIAGDLGVRGWQYVLRAIVSESHRFVARK